MIICDNDLHLFDNEADDFIHGKDLVRFLQQPTSQYLLHDITSRRSANLDTKHISHLVLEHILLDLVIE